LILDTHVAIWVSEELPIKASARREIAKSSKSGTLLLSAISAWEIATLVRLQRLRIGSTTEQYVRDLFSLPGVREAPVTSEIATTAGALPKSFHGDPADRIIVATASLLGLPLATRDERILRFAKDAGGLTCVPV
jgi:PIN domain nuclease of toxin-antitoxin system